MFFVFKLSRVVSVHKLFDGIIKLINPILSKCFNFNFFRKFNDVVNFYMIQDRKQDVVAVYISFGGLLCKLEGGKRELESLTLDQRLYVLIKRS